MVYQALLKPQCRGLLQARGYVGIGVQGDAHVGVAQAFAHDLGVNVGLKHEGGVSVPEIVEMDAIQPSPPCYLRELGFAKSQQRAPALILPRHRVDGGVIGYQCKPDHPRPNEKGKAVKYETPSGARNRLDVPPRCRPILGDPLVPLHITEGVKKADTLASVGACAVTIPGIWGWKGTNNFGGVTVLADFDHIAFKGDTPRNVYLDFDSDVTVNPSVKEAVRRLSEHIRRKGAIVHVTYLPLAPIVPRWAWTTIWRHELCLNE